MSLPPPSTRPALAPAPPPSAAPPPTGFALWLPFAALAVAYGVALVFTVILAGLAGVGTEDDLPAGVTLAGTFVQDAMLIVASVLLARSTGLRVTPALFGVRRVPLQTIGMALLLFAVFYAFLQVWGQLIDPSARDDAAEQLGAKGSTAALVAVAVLVAVVAPIVEEFFFRGLMFGALGRALGWLPGALITGLLFGAVHAVGTPLVFLVPLALFGFLLCLLYRRTGSLVPGMGVHAFNNALALGVSLHWAAPVVVVVVVAAPVIVVALATVAAD